MQGTVVIHSYLRTLEPMNNGHFWDQPFCPLLRGCPLEVKNTCSESEHAFGTYESPLLRRRERSLSEVLPYMIHHKP